MKQEIGIKRYIFENFSSFFSTTSSSASLGEKNVEKTQRGTFKTRSLFLYKSNHLMKILLMCLFIFLVILSTSHLWYQDLWTHADVSRDFLVLHDIIVTRKMTLIGPRSGAVQGLFHGPLWFYINLPAFILIEGNPVGMGWYWWCLAVIFLVWFFILCKHITKDFTLSLLATLLLSGSILHQITNFFNPIGAVLLSPFFFWSLFLFLRSPSFKLGLTFWLLLGMMVQFQMGFAAPLVVLVFPLFLWKVWQKKDARLLLSFSVFLLSISTFVLFDVRHNFLQLKSVIDYLLHFETHMSFFQIIISHGKSMLFGGWHVLFYWSGLSLFLVSIWIWRGLQKYTPKKRAITLLFLYLYAGYWVITLLYEGEIWSYYYQGFLPMTILWMASVAKKNVPLKLMLGSLALLNVVWTIPKLFYQVGDFDTSSWRLVDDIARNTLESEYPFGYFLYSQDQLAYPLKYAFVFEQQYFPERATPFEKKMKTVLVKSADDPRNPYSSASDWQRDKIKILKAPVSKTIYPFGYSVEVYRLSRQEVATKTDENLVKGLEFR